jgi:DNA-binding transcriptional LysR family regulator
MFEGFELRRIPYALALAKELNFGRAARRLHIEQPSLTSQIKHLESEISVQLFERNSQYVKLTPAGRRFIKHAKLALLHSERAIEDAKNSRPKDGPLVIAYSPRMNLELLSAVHFVSSLPSPKFKTILASLHTDEQIRGLVERSIHIGLVTLPVKHALIAAKPLIREPLDAVVPDSHRLAVKTDVKARELNGLPAISFPRRLSPVFHDHLYTLFRKQGYTPHVVQEVTTEAEALYMVAQGFGISFVKASAVSQEHPGVVCLRFRETNLVEETGIAYRRDNASDQIHSFAAALRKSVGEILRRAPSLPEAQADDDTRQLKLF